MTVRRVEQLLTANQAAARLDISERTLRKLRQAGAIPFIAVSERVFRYDAADCEEYLLNRKRTETLCPSPSKILGRRITSTTSRGTSGGFMAQRAARQSREHKST
jgi:excisionase family DNA binding protein